MESFRTFFIGENENIIEVTDFRDGMLYLKDGEGAVILMSVDQLTELITKLKEGEWC